MSATAAVDASRPLVNAGAGASVDVLDDPLELERCTRWTSTADGRRVAETRLQLSGMYCAACAGIIEHALCSAGAALDASVVAATQRATVRWDPARTRLSTLVAAVRAAGYEAVPDAAAPAREMRRREHRTALWRFFVASFCAMQVMMLATPGYVTRGDELDAQMRLLLNWGGWVLTLPVMWFAAGPYFRGAWQQLRARRVGMDVPVALALAVTFVGSMGATFDPGGVFGHEVYFDSLTMFLAFLLGGRYLELRARHRAAEELETALARLPETAERRAGDGQWETVSVRRLQREDVVRVALGQAFPADGVLLEGRTRVDEALLTGESEPQPRTVGEAVIAASINVGGPVLLRVERVGADTRYEAIVRMMHEAMSQRPASARVADRYAGAFLAAVVVLAGLGALVWSFIDPSRAIWVAVAVLIVTCPCAFALAAPAALVAAAGGLARRGVVFQRLEAIEVLAGVERLFIDKTGTLTEDRLVLREVRLLPGAQVDVQRAQACAAALAQWSQHPLARALAGESGGESGGALQAAPAAGVDGTGWRDLQEQGGQGLAGTDEAGRRWMLGHWRWVGGVGEVPDPQVRAWLACDGRVQAGFVLDEAVRAGAAEAIAGLRALGLRLTLLSGDAQGRAQALAERLGLDDAIGQASPEDKLACLAAAQAGGAKVGMVGDGINDAPVLARADVSLAMGQGALVARTQADAVIASNRPAELLLARRVALRTMRIVRQNMLWAVLYNAAFIPLALAGWLPPWLAGLGMAASSLLVILNALRAAR